ncbi:MAG: RNA polymerase sigma-70 factor [Gemmatimonadaceae bacterium]|nr:RNA polymerase sigma-70 factor [Gemmatimonadaceae bacterium]
MTAPLDDDGDPMEGGGDSRDLPPSDFPAPAAASLRGDADLLRRLRAGDERALEELFRAYYAGMCAFVRRFVHAPDIAEELVQDVFFKLWSKREALSDIDALRTYLFRAARNTALNHLRRKKLENAWEEQEAARGEPMTNAATDDDASTDEVSRAVNGAISRLPTRCREIFVMSREGNMTYAEIAGALGISIKTVETQMGRALKSLRASLAKYR